MLSPARQVANAANARYSTGPRTREGKQRSAQNARKHGLTARQFVIRDDEREAAEQLHAACLRDLKPRGEVEWELFDQIVHAAWNMRRIRRLEAQLETSAADPLLDEVLGPQLDRLARYYLRHERSYHRALKELRAVQTNRMLRDTFGLGDLADKLPVLVSISEMTKRTQQHESSLLDQQILEMEAELRNLHATRDGAIAARAHAGQAPEATACPRTPAPPPPRAGSETSCRT